jgi:hypothetical protein
MPKITVGLSCVAAFAFCCMAAVGAPPSEFVREANVWMRLEALMWPFLFAGPALALLASSLLPFTMRGAAIVCALAAGASMVGVALAWGIDAEAGFRGLVLPIVFLALPILGAFVALRYR